MKVVALDISTKTGWALFEGEKGSQPVLVSKGRVDLGAKIRGYHALPYPWDYLQAIGDLAYQIQAVVPDDADAVVIEETNGSRSRYTQKILEWIHMDVLRYLSADHARRPVYYVNTGDWRRTVGAFLTKDDKKLNARVRKYRANGKSLSELGVRGRVNKKHVAIRYVNEAYSLGLRMRENDIADAIALGTAWFLGAPVCDGN